jgi:hypothetical protein
MTAARSFVDDIQAEGETTPIVRYTVEAVLPGTNDPVTNITVGRDFEMRMLVEDLRDDGNPNRGVYAAFTDLMYDKSLAKVRVYEVQTLSILGAAPATGTFTLTLGPGQTTAPITYSKVNNPGRQATAIDIENKLNNLLGAGSVTVNWNSPGNAYQIRFSGLPDIDHPNLQVAPSGITLVNETAKGDPTNPASFSDAFISRDLPGTTGTAGPFDIDVTAIDAFDRIDEMGGQRGLDAPPGNIQTEVVRVRMTASLPAGQVSRVLTLTPFFGTLANPAQLSAHKTLVFNDRTQGEFDDEVPVDAITSIGAALTITLALSAQNGAAEVNEDSSAGVAIPILPLVTKNTGAPPGPIELRSFTQPATGGTVQRLDPANTPADLSDDLVRFIPAPNFTGTTTFTYTAGIVGDPLPADQATGTITVTVNPENDAPENIVPAGQLTPEDQALVFSLANGNLIRVVDPDADPAGLRVSLAASHGDLTLSTINGLAFTLGDGTKDAIMTFSGTTAAVNAALAGLSYKPGTDNTATATLTITSNDIVAGGSGGLKQDIDTVSISITPANDAPQVNALAAQNAFTLNALVFSPSFGNAIIVTDADAGSDALNVTVTATGGIGTLTANNAAGATINGNGTTSLTINGSLVAINAALDGLTLTPPSTTASGSINIVADDLGHNPGPPRTGQHSISITVSVPTGPFAVSDVPGGLVEGSASYSINVLSNDLATSGNQAVIFDFTQPAVGSVSVSNNLTPADPTDDRFVYTPPLKNGLPDLDFFTPASGQPITFTYRVNQSPGAGTTSPPGTVTIRIANIADIPVANNDGVNNSYSTAIGATLTKNAAQGVLANDTSADNQYGDPNVAALSVLGAAAGTPLVLDTAQGGRVTVNVDGSFTYVPAAGFGGNDTFTYRAHSNLGTDSNTATVTLHVSAPPTAGPDSFTTAQEDTVFVSTSSVLLNDLDLSDNEQLIAVLVTNVPAAAGSVSLGADGIFTYTPTPHFNTTRPPAAPITFTYKATNQAGTRESAPATVSITVNDTNDNPTANGDTFDAVQRKGTIGIDQLVVVLNNDQIAPDAQETLQVVGLSGTTSVTANASGNAGPVATSGGGSVRLENFQIRYNSPTTTGVDSFSYTVSDGRGGTSTATVQVTVLPPFDYGDAADTYGTTLFSNGARHFAVGPQLGLLRDEEGNATSAIAATGDDLTESDDEDGVSASLLLRGKASSLTISASAAALLDAWIDYNLNGTFDAAEQIATSTALAAGANVINFTVPAAAVLGSAVARLRISTAGGLGPTGAALDGEVEDHTLTILQDLEVDLPSGNGVDRVALRVSGSDVQVFNLNTNLPVAASPQAFTRNVVVRGSASEADEITVDYAAGGFPSVLGTIQVDGGTGAGDLLVVQGAAGGTNTAQYQSQGLSLGNATLRTSQGATNHDVQFTNFEPVTINGMASFEAIGNLNVGGDTLTLSVAAPATLGALATVTGGTINSNSGIALATGQTLRASGTVNGPISSAAGSTIEATGPLTLGNALVAFAISGNLSVGPHSVTILASGRADLGVLTTLGSAAGGGTLNVATGVNLAAGDKIQGLGTLNTPNVAGQAVVNNGVIQGNSAAEKITLPGFITGTGSLDNVILTGTLSPGASPAAVSFGSVSFTPTSKLIVEVGGTTAGTQYDQINFTGAAALGGTIEVSLTGGFSPAIGDAFNVINATGGVSGDFATFTQPGLAVRQRWWDDLTPSAGLVQLLVSPKIPRQNPKAGDTIPALGIRRLDVDDSGTIVAFDALQIINQVNAFGPTDVPLTPGYVMPFLDVNGDNRINAQDALDVINVINAGLNVVPPGGEGEAVFAATAVALSRPLAPVSSLSDTIALLAQDLVENATRKRRG